VENQGDYERRDTRCRSGRVTQFKPGRGDHLLAAGFGFRADKATPARYTQYMYINF
jgi:hypothetical protein